MVPKVFSMDLFQFLILGEDLLTGDEFLGKGEFLDESIHGEAWILEVFEHLAFFLEVDIKFSELFHSYNLEVGLLIGHHCNIFLLMYFLKYF
jgi:hypothetical protein